MRKNSAVELLISMSQELIILFFVTALISIFLATVISKKISDSINKIDLDNPENSKIYTELHPFIKRIQEENFEKEQRESLRQQFSANVSHELKTPLTSISGFAEILKTGVKDGDLSKKNIIDFSSSIYDESQRMITLVNDIIKLSRLDEDSISQQREPVSLREITKEVLDMVQDEAKKKKITFNLTGDSGNIIGVSSVIYEMIFNLCDNAIKYNKEGGHVFIKINTDRAGSENDSSVSISVGDTGIGVPEQEKERIFERFYRIDKSRSKALGGTGLGLSIVKHGARYHNAGVSIESKFGEGSIFTVNFPV